MTTMRFPNSQSLNCQLVQLLQSTRRYFATLVSFDNNLTLGQNSHLFVYIYKYIYLQQQRPEWVHNNKYLAKE